MGKIKIFWNKNFLPAMEVKTCFFGSFRIRRWIRNPTRQKCYKLPNLSPYIEQKRLNFFGPNLVNLNSNSDLPKTFGKTRSSLCIQLSDYNSVVLDFCVLGYVPNFEQNSISFVRYKGRLCLQREGNDRYGQKSKTTSK